MSDLESAKAEAPHADGPTYDQIEAMAWSVVWARPEATEKEHLGALMTLNSGKLPVAALKAIRWARTNCYYAGEKS